MACGQMPNERSMDWQFQDAEARFGEIVQMALKEGSQTTKLPGGEAVVVLAAGEYRRLTGYRRNLKALSASAPLEDGDIERRADPAPYVPL
jgi:hypothetical protein